MFSIVSSSLGKKGKRLQLTVVGESTKYGGGGTVHGGRGKVKMRSAQYILEGKVLTGSSRESARTHFAARRRWWSGEAVAQRWAEAAAMAERKRAYARVRLGQMEEKGGSSAGGERLESA